MHPVVEAQRDEIATLCRRLGLERLLGRPVDVVSARAITNPYFAAQVKATRERLYAA